MSRKAKQGLRGYTLIEMAISLVIAGILLGAVLQARELIENARLKSIINDFESITQAYYAYIKRTGYPPGRTYFYGNWGVDDEISTVNFFKDLSAEGFTFKFENNTELFNAYGGVWSISTGLDPELNNDFQTPTRLCTGGLSLSVVRAIDQKIDDGHPKTGRVTSKVINQLLSSYREGAQITEEDKFVICRSL